VTRRSEYHYIETQIWSRNIERAGNPSKLPDHAFIATANCCGPLAGHLLAGGALIAACHDLGFVLAGAQRSFFLDARIHMARAPRRPAWESPRRLKIQDKASIAANTDPWSFSNLRPLLLRQPLNGVEMEGALAHIFEGYPRGQPVSLEGIWHRNERQSRAHRAFERCRSERWSFRELLSPRRSRDL
jgi:hypothetical protein